MRVAILLFPILLLLPTPALLADDHDEPEAREEIREGLEHGIDALRALGGHERVVRHLEGVLERLEHDAEHREDEPRGRRAEHEIVEHWIELMAEAHELLAEKDREALANALEEAIDGFEAMLDGARDARPAIGEAAEALLMAAELAHAIGERARSKAFAQLGRDLEERARHEHRRDDEGEEPYGSLDQRIEVLRLAMPALREARKVDEAELLERAIHTGELMLEGREDDEARRVFERTPGLDELSEILELAGDLWARFGDREKARGVHGLAAFYAERLELDEDEELEHDEEEHEVELDEHRDRAVDELRAQVHEMRTMLQELANQIEALRREIAHDRK